MTANILVLCITIGSAGSDNGNDEMILWTRVSRCIDSGRKGEHDGARVDMIITKAILLTLCSNSCE